MQSIKLNFLVAAALAVGVFGTASVSAQGISGCDGLGRPGAEDIGNDLGGLDQGPAAMLIRCSALASPVVVESRIVDIHASRASVPADTRNAHVDVPDIAKSIDGYRSPVPEDATHAKGGGGESGESTMGDALRMQRLPTGNALLHNDLEPQFPDAFGARPAREQYLFGVHIGF